MSYTDEEERWLKLQSSHVDEAFRTVPIGDEMLNEFSMYSLGVPLSRRYMKSVFSITLERMWRVLRVHPEFQELSGQAQREVMEANGSLGLAVMISFAPVMGWFSKASMVRGCSAACLAAHGLCLL